MSAVMLWNPDNRGVRARDRCQSFLVIKHCRDVHLSRLCAPISRLAVRANTVRSWEQDPRGVNQLVPHLVSWVSRHTVGTTSLFEAPVEVGNVDPCNVRNKDRKRFVVGCRRPLHCSADCYGVVFCFWSWGCRDLKRTCAWRCEKPCSGAEEWGRGFAFNVGAAHNLIRNCTTP